MKNSEYKTGKFNKRKVKFARFYFGNLLFFDPTVDPETDGIEHEQCNESKNHNA